MLYAYSQLPCSAESPVSEKQTIDAHVRGQSVATRRPCLDQPHIVERRFNCAPQPELVAWTWEPLMGRLLLPMGMRNEQSVDKLTPLWAKVDKYYLGEEYAKSMIVVRAWTESPLQRS